MPTRKSQSEEMKELESAKQAAKDAYSNFLDAQSHLKAAAIAAGVDLKATAQEQLDAALSMTSKKKAEMVKETSEYIIDNPLTSAGIAFLSGYVVSKLLSRP